MTKTSIKREEKLQRGGSVDFVGINAAALAAFPAVLKRLLPDGKNIGREFEARNPRRADRKAGSFRVNRHNGKLGGLRLR
jgi:hypothetical protein